jgi:mannose-6-phosphate isomerase-like protein (cupin superfamily)
MSHTKKNQPRRREAFAHRHRDAEEVYVVLAGSGCVKLDDEFVDLVELDAVRVGRETTRQFAAGPNGLELLAKRWAPAISISLRPSK